MMMAFSDRILESPFLRHFWEEHDPATMDYASRNGARRLDSAAVVPSFAPLFSAPAPFIDTFGAFIALQLSAARSFATTSSPTPL
jgi:hypothetical protein